MPSGSRNRQSCSTTKTCERSCMMPSSSAGRSAQKVRTIGSAGASALSICGVELQRDRVDAVALIGGSVVSLTFEDMAHMGIAVGAPDLDALHAHRRVTDVADAVLGQGRVERRPSAVRGELRVRGEEVGAAGSALVHPGRGLGVVLTAERPFGRALAQYRVLLGAEHVLPADLLTVCLRAA